MLPITLFCIFVFFSAKGMHSQFESNCVRLGKEGVALTVEKDAFPTPFLLVPKHCLQRIYPALPYLKNVNYQ